MTSRTPPLASTPKTTQATARTPFFWVYSPFQTDPELLEAIFTGREELLQDVIARVAESCLTKSKHYLLLYGPRGSGKTHFLAMLVHRLRQRPELCETMRIALLHEDEISPNFANFLNRIYQALSTGYPSEFPAEEIDKILDLPMAQIAAAIENELISRLKGRTLMIFLENLDVVFASLGVEGQHSFRAFLANHQQAAVVATSPQLSKEFIDRNLPFFGFFRQFALKPFSVDDAHEILTKLARVRQQADLVAYLGTPEGRGRVRAVHHLAGGNQRVYMVLSSLVTPESLDQLIVPFQKLADELTPYYQERVWSLPTLQRSIIQELCRSPQSISPSAMARRLISDENSIGKQMNLLAEKGYLISSKRGRESFYELSEPLMRISFEVKQRRLLDVLVDFLRCWYEPEKLHDQKLQSNSDLSIRYMEAALDRAASTPDPRLKLLENEIESATEECRTQELAKLWEEKAVVTKTAADWSLAGYYFAEFNKNHKQALGCYDTAIQIDPNHVIAKYNRVASLFQLDRWREGFESLDQIISSNTLSDNFGDVGSILTIIFEKSSSDEVLRQRLARFFNHYLAAEQKLFPQADLHSAAPPLPPLGVHLESPLSWFGEGLVKSLARINAERLSPAVLESYIQVAADLFGPVPRMELPLRLFRYGVLYLLQREHLRTKDPRKLKATPEKLAESVFVELVTPEREILRQALKLVETTV